MKLTPGMKQYMEAKNQNPDAICLFRMGDFYETFYDDAKTIARELNIVLTSRGKGETKAPLAGIPYHALEQYLAKLIRKGYKVAIVEQLEDPKKAKGLVKRGIVRIVTLGTLIEDSMLDERSNNYIFSVLKQEDSYGFAISDMSTGEFMTSKSESMDKLLSEINRFMPSEIIVPVSQEDEKWVKDIKELGIITYGYDDRHYWHKKAEDMLHQHFNIINLEGFGIKDEPLMIGASGALISYLLETQMTSMKHISAIRKFVDTDHMILDASTQRNLELIRNIRDSSSRGTLIETIDMTKTAMGSRLIKKWLLRPLFDMEKIKQRQDSVLELVIDTLARERLRDSLGNILDMERLISRISYGAANARDINALKNSLSYIPEIKTLLSGFSSTIISRISTMDELNDIYELIDRAIEEEPPLLLRDGNIIKPDYDEELSKLKEITRGGKKFIAGLEQKERERTGIKSLKIKYNRVFGYFIEVTKRNLHLVPREYIRKQTQVNSERFITDELKSQEELILGAEEKMHELEFNIFQDIVKQIAVRTEDIQGTADNIAKIDVLCSLAKVAVDNNYVRPVINNEDNITIIDSRHPVLETLEDIYIPNDIMIDDKNLIQIITGPNMAGKSSYMRQAALIVIMAQMGSFIPASKASICLVDRIFTRVGAYDDLTMGQSTFMVEMCETANILNNATSGSLIILDEIGRGTSTYDGVSLAIAIAEYIHDKIRAKTLFATHYHQMNKLEERFEGIRNYNITVKEFEDKIVFLRKMVEGGTDKSYGIQVAKLAGVPKQVIDRSKVIMSGFELDDEASGRLHSELKKRLLPEKEKIKEKKAIEEKAEKKVKSAINENEGKKSVHEDKKDEIKEGSVQKSLLDI